MSIEKLILSNLGGVLSGGVGLAAITYFYLKLNRLTDEGKDMKTLFANELEDLEEDMENKFEDIKENVGIMVNESICALRHKNLDATIQKLDDNTNKGHDAIFKKLDSINSLLLTGKK